MPSFAYVETPLRCPRCAELIQDWARFQWGYCPAAAPTDRDEYYIGDSIRWGTGDDGTIPAWTHFDLDEKVHSLAANIGDPQYTDIIVIDRMSSGFPCPACATPLYGTLVEIRAGRIVSARILTPSEYEDVYISYYLIQPDGALRPMPEWFDHPWEAHVHGHPPPVPPRARPSAP